MTDDPTKKKADSQRVNVNQPHEVRTWTNRFGCSEAELRAAVRALLDEGREPMADAVADRIAAAKKTENE